MLCPKKHPILKDRFRLLSDIIENTSDNYDKADKAELRIIGELRKTGKKVMNGCALMRENVRAESVQNNVNTISHGKKKLFRHTAFGEITVSERVFLNNGRPVRPFSAYCGIKRPV